MYDLILLDLDGTISDPAVGFGRSINYALSHFDYPPIEMSDIADFIGPQIDETFARIAGSSSINHIRDLVDKYRERYADVGYSENELYPGISEALELLGRLGVPMAVCTLKRADFAERILQMFELRHHFQFIDGGDVGIHKWQQVEKLRAEGKVSTSTVMVGDRSVDMVAAHRNGLKAAGVLWGYGSKMELLKEKPAHILSSPVQLPSLADGTAPIVHR